MVPFIYYWIDTIWLPLAFFTVHKKHRWITLGFITACMILMRLQNELMETLGYPNGILPMIESHVNSRQLIVYSIFYILFLIMAHYSPNSERVVFLGACLAIFFMIFTASSLLILL